MKSDSGIIDALAQRYLPASLRLKRAAAEMRKRHESSMAARMMLLKYCLADSLNLDFFGDTCQGPIWQYWAQGRDNAPALVKECLRSVQKHCGNREIIVLDDLSVQKYAEIPEFMKKVQGENKTHFSDYLRCTLLSTHGGTWIDATVFLGGAPDHAMVTAPFFAFTRPADPFLLSSWFMHSSRAHPIVTGLKIALEKYWMENEKLIDYFTLHFLFEGLVTLNPKLKKQWQRVPRFSSAISHEMQNALHDEFSEDRFAYLASRTNVHKLSYKLADVRHPYITFLEVIESGDFANWKSLVKRQTKPALPPDFDGEGYLKLNRDVAAAGVDAAMHYLESGCREGRRWR